MVDGLRMPCLGPVHRLLGDERIVILPAAAWPIAWDEIDPSGSPARPPANRPGVEWSSGTKKRAVGAPGRPERIVIESGRRKPPRERDARLAPDLHGREATLTNPAGSKSDRTGLSARAEAASSPLSSSPLPQQGLLPLGGPYQARDRCSRTRAWSHGSASRGLGLP